MFISALWFHSHSTMHIQFPNQTKSTSIFQWPSVSETKLGTTESITLPVVICKLLREQLLQTALTQPWGQPLDPPFSSGQFIPVATNQTQSSASYSMFTSTPALLSFLLCLEEIPSPPSKAGIPESAPPPLNWAALPSLGLPEHSCETYMDTSLIYTSLLVSLPTHIPSLCRSLT
jgi:hypothetical protein